MKIFISAPFWNEKEAQRIDEIKNFLHKMDHKTFCAKDDVPRFDPKKGQKDRDRVFKMERNAILKFDLVLALLEHPSSGCAMEMQFAIDHKIPVILFIFGDDPNLNQSIWLDQTTRVRNTEELEAALKRVR